MSEDDDVDLIPAATVLLLRDRSPLVADGDAADGDSASRGDSARRDASHDDGRLEVLMVRRNSTIAFGGMWVFPGGRVDHDEMVDGDPLASARVAAVREVAEETGLTISGDDLVDWSQWIPPEAAAMVVRGPRRRFSTWFFAVAAPEGTVAIDHGEIHDDVWITPAQAHRQHADGSIELAPPTWVTLWQLARHSSVASALEWARIAGPQQFRTKALSKDPITLAWDGDAAYESGDLTLSGPRNRLIVDNRSWSYHHTP